MSVANAKLKKLEEMNIMDEAIRMLSERAMRSIRSHTPGSGTMRDAWTKHEDIGGDGHVDKITIFNTYEPKEIVGYMENGTPPHGIDPKPENAIQRLVFFWPAVDAVVFARHVNHPGTRPYGMIDNTVTMLNLEKAMFERIFEVKISAFASTL
jgi:hypothetical protein